VRIVGKKVGASVVGDLVGDLVGWRKIISGFSCTKNGSKKGKITAVTS